MSQGSGTQEIFWKVLDQLKWALHPPSRLPLSLLLYTSPGTLYHVKARIMTGNG